MALRRLFGSMGRAWQLCLDVNTRGVCSFNDFCKAARCVGVEGNVKLLFAVFDEAGNGILTFGDLAPQVHALIEEWKQKVCDCDEKQESLLDGWRTFFDPDLTGVSSKIKFQAGCERIGFTAAELLFDLLDTAWSNFVSLDEIDLAAGRRLRG